jgi:hypothetical protein
MSRVEVLPGPERRRRWSAEQKRSIVAEPSSRTPMTTSSEIELALRSRSAREPGHGFRSFLSGASLAVTNHDSCHPPRHDRIDAIFDLITR